MDLEDLLGITRTQQLIFQERLSSFPTQQGSNLQQICSKIAQIKNVKVGKKRQLKLVQQNAKNIRPVHRYTRQLNRKITIDQSEKNISESVSTTVSLKKKYIKKNNGIKRAKINRLSNEMSQEKLSDKTIESQSLEGEAKNQEKITFKQKGLKITGNILQGVIGHSTLIFEQEIVQGSYYLEFKILEIKQNSNYKCEPNVRIGACSKFYELDTPLGLSNSVGFNLKKNCLVTEGRRYAADLASNPVKNGDIIGLLLEFSPAYRHPCIDEKWEDSSISYFINGECIAKYENLRQMFYHPAISLYNGARVSMRTKQQQMTYMPELCLAYQKISQYKNMYN